MSTSAGHVRNQRGRFPGSSYPAIPDHIVNQALRVMCDNLVFIKLVNREYDDWWRVRESPTLEAATVIGGLCLQYIPKAQAVFIRPIRTGSLAGSYAFRVHSTASRVRVQSGVRRLRVVLNGLGAMAGRHPLCTIISR